MANFNFLRPNIEDAKVSNTENYEEYSLWLGTFKSDKFSWKKIKSFKNDNDAYISYKKYINKLIQYSDEELIKFWSSGRIDVELRKGNKLINWCGIYTRLGKDSRDEE